MDMLVILKGLCLLGFFITLIIELLRLSDDISILPDPKYGKILHSALTVQLFLVVALFFGSDIADALGDFFSWLYENMRYDKNDSCYRPNAPFWCSK